MHALGEEEHAAIGHEAVTVFVPVSHAAHVRQAMRDHDRDFAIYYNALADLIDVTQGKHEWKGGSVAGGEGGNEGGREGMTRIE